MWIGLTGSPRVGATPFPDQAAVAVRAEDESVVRVGRRGAVEDVEVRLRVVGEITWAAMSEADGAALLSALGQRATIDVRTTAAGDWGAELAVDVVRTSDVELTTPLRPYDPATGRPVVTVAYAFRSARTYTLDELGAGPVGGWDLTATDADSETTAPYGSATETESAFPVTFLGQTYNLTAVELGDARTAAARVRAVGDHGAEIHYRTP